MYNPLVSAIIIFLNAGRFIEEAIESVFSQTYPNWELLLVDDGSDDAGSAIARSCAEKYPGKVIYLEHPGHQNRGMSSSRNLGVKSSRGEFVAFLDADDVWLPQKLEEQVEIMRLHPRASMVYGRTEIWHSWTGNGADPDRDYMLALGVPPDTLIAPPALLMLLLENKVQSPTTCSALMRRQVFEQTGGFEDSFKGMYEDQPFFIKVCLKMPVYVSEKIWARYRQHPDSCCALAEKTGEDYRGRQVLLNWIAAYFSREAVRDPQLWRALRRELLPYEHPVLYRLLHPPRRPFKRLKAKLARVLRRVAPGVGFVRDA